MRTADEDSRVVTNAVLGLVGETGEVVDILKKNLYHGHPLNRHALAEELGDVTWYIALLCELYNIDFADVLECNIAKLRLRYPEGFSEEASRNR